MDNIRLRRILAYLKVKKSCSVAELMDKFDISSATAHRDIEALAKRDAVERVRGGIVYNDAPDARSNSANYQERVVAHRSEKTAAARKALSLITEGDILFLDSSTTTYELALLLMHEQFDHLTVITNSIAVMNLFRKFPPHWSMIGLGGNYDPQLNSILGMSALEQLSRFNLTKAFVSCFGVDDKNATTNHERQAEMLRKVLDTADKRYLIVDHKKIGRKGLYRISARGGFDAIISDVSAKA
jgi:DeoR family myo-inositol catabolism operon transcriptional repressor